MYNGTSDLIWVNEIGRDEDGYPEYEEVIESVFVDERSVGRNEYYAAQRNGIKTVITLAMNLDELEELIRQHGKPAMATYYNNRYRVERLYKNRKANEYELILAEG